MLKRLAVLGAALGGSVLWGFVVPIIQQRYPDLFANQWALELATGIVVACFFPGVVYGFSYFYKVVDGFWGERRFMAITTILVAGAVAGMSLAGIGYAFHHGFRARQIKSEKATSAPLSAPNAVPTAPADPGNDSSGGNRPAAGPRIPSDVRAHGSKQAAQAATPPTQAVIVQTGPVFGNLGDRSNALANEIMQDLYLHGWRGFGQQNSGVPPFQQMPTKGDELKNWMDSRSSYFRFRFVRRVIAIRDEFAQLHIQDQRLDEILKYEVAEQGAVPIPPQSIEEVARRLRVLASQIPVSRTAPKPISFAVTQVQPEKPQFPFEIIVTIRSDEDVVSGYVAVEFEGQMASVATDFSGSTLLDWNSDELIGNKQLKDYLAGHSMANTYVLAIGNHPLTSSNPIHVIAYGAKEFRVKRVLLFEK